MKIKISSYKSYLLLIADLVLPDPNFESFDFLLAIVLDFVVQCPSWNETIEPEYHF